MTKSIKQQLISARSRLNRRVAQAESEYCDTVSKLKSSCHNNNTEIEYEPAWFDSESQMYLNYEIVTCSDCDKELSRRIV